MSFDVMGRAGVKAQVCEVGGGARRLVDSAKTRSARESKNGEPVRMHRPDSARTAQKRQSAQEGLLRGWLRRRVGGFAWGGVPLEPRFLRRKPFHFLVLIGGSLK